jgi:N-acetylmuramoyl-L-alanine amidase
MNNPEIDLYKAIMRKFSIYLILCLASLPCRALSAIPVDTSGELESYEIGDDTYVKSSSLASFLGGNETIDFLGKAGKIDFDGFSLEYSLFSPFIRSGDDVYNIYKPVEYKDGSFLLPIYYLVSVLNKVSSFEFAWAGRKLRVSRPSYNVIGVNAFQKINGLLLEIYLKDQLKFDAVKTDDNWLVVTISGGKVDSLAFQKHIGSKAVYEVKTYQFDNSCQVSIRLRPQNLTFTSKLKEDPLRIQFLIRGEGFNDSSATAEDSQSSTENPIDVIVIDPGHGGDDNGAVGPSSVKEKDIVLKIAKQLNKLLKDDGHFKPVMTRQDDIFVPLSERTSLANSVGGDLFISIHANAAKNKKAAGMMTFSLASAKTDEARAAATLENNSIRFENIENQKLYATDLDFTLRDMVQTEYQRESVELSDIIAHNIAKATGIESRGIDQAGFYVLDKAYMPSVLVETAFISNSSDEKKLKNEEFQKKVAKAIYDSIITFKDKYESQKRTSQ